MDMKQINMANVCRKSRKSRLLFVDKVGSMASVVVFCRAGGQGGHIGTDTGGSNAPTGHVRG